MILVHCADDKSVSEEPLGSFEELERRSAADDYVSLRVPKPAFYVAKIFLERIEQGDFEAS